MAKVTSGTLDANDETFVVSVSPGQKAKVRLDISSTITVTATENGAAFTKADGTTAAAWTASEVIGIQLPGIYTFTASGVSGGSCDWEAVVY